MTVHQLDILAGLLTLHQLKGDQSLLEVMYVYKRLREKVSELNVELERGTDDRE